MSIAVNPVRGERATWTLADFFASPAFYWLMLAVYLLLHVVLRLWETPNIGKNDVQEAVAAQGWALGYHPRNPPLHTWLLMSSYAVFGVGTLAHVVLKYVLLGATYGFAYLSARRLVTPALAALAALSLTLLTPFAWTVHTALTHTLLLAAIDLATLWAAIRLSEQRRLLDYVVFGVVLGLGLLTKYSYALFLIPLLAAMLTVAPLRRSLADWRILLSIAIAALLFAPHAEWMLTVRFNFVEFLAEKQRSAVEQSYLADLGEGLGSVIVGALSFLGPMAFVALAAWLRLRKQKPAEAAGAWTRALPLIAVYSLGLLALDVIVLRATQFEERYFLSALLIAPLIGAQWLDRREGGLKQLKWISAVVLLVALIGAGGLIGRGMLFHNSCDRCWNEMPMADVNRAVRSTGFTEGTIVSDHYNVAGNLRLTFPRANIVAANYQLPQVYAERPEGQCMLVWNARVAGEDMPNSLRTYLTDRGLTPEGAPSHVEALLLRDHERLDRFAYWLVPNADGDCRPR